MIVISLVVFFLHISGTSWCQNCPMFSQALQIYFGRLQVSFVVAVWFKPFFFELSCSVLFLLFLKRFRRYVLKCFTVEVSCRGVFFL